MTLLIVLLILALAATGIVLLARHVLRLWLISAMFGPRHQPDEDDGAFRSLFRAAATADTTVSPSPGWQERTLASATARTLHPMCDVCGFRRGGHASWDGTSCKCGLRQPAIGTIDDDEALS